MAQQQYVIIVAGGSGSRMKSEVPKQFIEVCGLPVLMHTIRAFQSYSKDLGIVLVLPEAQFQTWWDLCGQYKFSAPYILVAGGATRFHSVLHGLQSITTSDALVAVHDGVRPIIHTTIIAEGFQSAAMYGTAVAALELKDSIREVKADGKNAACDRSSFRLIQTPQTFRIDWMRAAFEQPYRDTFTDCASVLESAGYPIQLIEGAYDNIKLTTPEDLRWAEIYLTSTE